MLLRGCAAFAILAGMAMALLAGMAQFSSLIVQLLRPDQSGDLIELGFPSLRILHLPIPDWTRSNQVIEIEPGLLHSP
jgi:hypothetical protein